MSPCFSFSSLDLILLRLGLGIWDLGLGLDNSEFRIHKCYQYNIKVPVMPLVFPSSDNNTRRFNLRKLGELSFHLARAGRQEDLYKNCLFNFDWMYIKVKYQLFNSELYNHFSSVLLNYHLCKVTMRMQSNFVKKKTEGR